MSDRLPDSDKWGEWWDSNTTMLPEPGENELLDSLCQRKHITINDLARVGARLTQQHVLAFSYPKGVKLRDLITDRKWSVPGSEFGHAAKIVPGSPGGLEKLIVVEGETDAARMSAAHPDLDVMVTWAFEGEVPESWLETVGEYGTVFIGLDTDGAGEMMARKLEKRAKNPVRWKPPAKDWCEVEGDLPPLPEPPKPAPVIAWGQELHDLKLPERPSLLENELLPHDGMLMLHAWKGSFKSWLTFDLMVALATGGQWAGFETTEPELRVLIAQFEVKPTYYAERLHLLREQLPASQKQLYHNLGTLLPGRQLMFQIKAQNNRDELLKILVDNEVNVVLFDPIRSMIGGSSVYEQETQMILVDYFRRINQEGIAVVFTHHDSKSAARTGGGSPLDATAADALVGVADSIVSVQLPHGDDLETSTRRNLRFTLRNSPPIAARGFSIVGERVEYTDEAFGDSDPEVEDGQRID